MNDVAIVPELMGGLLIAAVIVSSMSGVRPPNNKQQYIQYTYRYIQSLKIYKIINFFHLVHLHVIY